MVCFWLPGARGSGRGTPQIGAECT
jgi:hypothetical protein